MPSVGLQTIDDNTECPLAADALGYEIHGGVLPGPKVVMITVGMYVLFLLVLPCCPRLLPDYDHNVQHVVDGCSVLDERNLFVKPKGTYVSQTVAWRSQI